MENTFLNIAWIRFIPRRTYFITCCICIHTHLQARTCVRRFIATTETGDVPSSAEVLRASHESCQYFFLCFYFSLYSSILLCCVCLSLLLPFYDLVFIINDTTLIDSIGQSTLTSRFARRASFGKREMCSSQVFHCLLNCLGSGSLLPERGLGAAFLWLTQELL